MIKFLNLQSINQPYNIALQEAAARVIDSGWYIMGNELSTFEKESTNENTKYYNNHS